MTSYKKMRRRLGLYSARQQSHTVESIHDAMVELRELFPKAGAREMRSLLFHRYGMNVSRYAIICFIFIFVLTLLQGVLSLSISAFMNGT